MRTVKLIALILTAATVAGGLGCQATGSATATEESTVSPFDRVPEDFSIDLTVRCGEAVPLAAGAHLRPARYVLFSDGSLHYAEDLAERGPNWLPPRTRTLNRRQLASVWMLAETLGLTGSDRLEPVQLTELEPAPEARLYVMAFVADDTRWLELASFASIPGLEETPIPLVRRLAQLAWAEDELPATITVIPRRYDLGPDPYERYR